MIDPQLTAFFHQFTAFESPQDQILVSADTQPAGVYLVESGLVRQYLGNEEGKELVVNLYKPGSLFPLIWAIGEVENNYYFETMIPTVTYRAPATQTREFLRAHPDLVWGLMQRVFVGVDGLLQQLAYSVMGSTTQKVVAAIVLLARRFGMDDGNIRIDQAFTHRELASMAGVSRESVTRVVSRLVSEGIVRTNQHRIEIIDPERLLAQL